MAPPFDDRQHDRSSEPLPDSIQLLRSLVRAVDSLASDFDVVELCQQLLEACTEVTGASDAGLLLADQRGELQVLASTNESARLLGLLQHEGPTCMPTGTRPRHRSPICVPTRIGGRSSHLRHRPRDIAPPTPYRCDCAATASAR